MAGAEEPVTRRAGILAMALLLCAGCGGADEQSNANTIAPPQRSAAQDESLRALLVDVAEAQLCDRLQGTFVALPDGDAEGGARGGSSPSAGRLWIRRCSAERSAGRLALTLVGPGWTWVERSSAGPVGTSFTVRGHLRFHARIALSGEVDVSYAAEHHLVTVWLTPASSADATITPTAAVPVAPDGGWSSFVGSVGGVFGPSIEERARPMVEEQGSTQMSERLSQGFTFTVDLCTGQADSIVGPLGNGETPIRPYPPDGARWLDNQRVRLRPGGLDVAGPFEAGATPVHVDYEVEQGGPIEVRAYCLDEAREVVDAFLEGRPAQRGSPQALHRVPRGAPSFVELDASSCPTALVVTPTGAGSDPTVFRYRAFAVGDEATPLVRGCR